MKCLKCNNEIPDNAGFCPICGSNLQNNIINSSSVNTKTANQEKAKKKSLYPLFMTILSIALVLTVVISAVTCLINYNIISFPTFSTSDKSDEKQDEKESENKRKTENNSETQKAINNEIEIKNYAGKDYDTLLSELKDLDVEVMYEHSDTAEKNCIIEQSIEAGTIVKKGAKITLTVSSGKIESPYDYEQIVKVSAKSGSSDAKLIMYEWQNGNWEKKFTCKAKVGNKGISSDYGEGISATPKGNFKLGLILSAKTIENTNLDTRVVTTKTCIVDDADSPLYNTLQSTTELPAGTHYDPIGNTILSGFSKAVMYIEHNGDGISTEGVMPNKGSAITICGVNGKLSATAGCIDITANDFDNLVSLLKREKNPHIETIIE